MSDKQSLQPTKSKGKSVVKRSLVSQSYHYSGPIPHPSLLNQYDPDTRKIIVTMARDQSRHRHSIESSIIQSNIQNERTGMYLAAFLTFCLIVSGVILLIANKNIAGFLSIFGPTIFQAGSYIYNKRKEEDITPERKKSETSK